MPTRYRNGGPTVVEIEQLVTTPASATRGGKRTKYKTIKHSLPHDKAVSYLRDILARGGRVADGGLSVMSADGWVRWFAPANVMAEVGWASNPGPRSKKCQLGYHDFEPATGLCKRVGCQAVYHAGQGSLFAGDVDPDHVREARARQERTGQSELFGPGGGLFGNPPACPRCFSSQPDSYDSLRKHEHREGWRAKCAYCSKPGMIGRALGITGRVSQLQSGERVQLVAHPRCFEVILTAETLSKNPPRRRRNPDESLRQLEREAAATGDPATLARLELERHRRGLPSIATEILDRLMRVSFEFDRSFIGYGPNDPAPMVLVARERGRQKEEIDEVGRRVLGTNYYSEYYGNSGMWIGTRDSDYESEGWKGLIWALNTIGYKTDEDGRVYFKPERLAVARAIHPEYLDRLNAWRTGRVR